VLWIGYLHILPEKEFGINVLCCMTSTYPKLYRRRWRQSRKPLFGTSVTPGRYEQIHWKITQRKLKANPLQNCTCAWSISEPVQQQIQLV